VQLSFRRELAQFYGQKAYNYNPRN